MKKNCLLLFICLFVSSNIFSEKFQIRNVEYLIEGSSKKENIEHKIKIDKNKIFNSEDELNSYFNQVKSKFINLRLFDDIKIESALLENDEQSQINFVDVNIFLKDSNNFLVLPCYKYDSTDGNVIKAKIKDSNFLGTLNEAAGDISFYIDPKSQNQIDLGLGLDFAYNFPFYFGIIEASWNNDYDFKYIFGQEIPEWKINTGFTFSIPLNNISFTLTIAQKFINDFDYKIFNDNLYFGNDIDFSIPIVLQSIPNWGDLIYTPSINFTYNWSDHQINFRNDDLISPELLFSNKIATENVNWIKNFRQGASFYAKEDVGYNFLINKIIFGIESELQLYFDWKYAGMNLRMYGFSYINKNFKIAKRIRGIRNEENFITSGYTDLNATSTPQAFVLNLDFPIKVLTMDFENCNWNLLRKLGFEVQFCPFIDFALTKNRVTNRTFDIRDSFICAGLEVIVFPLKFKSMQIRASAGVDVGSILFNNLDFSWRPNVSPYELSIGLGLHY